MVKILIALVVIAHTSYSQHFYLNGRVVEISPARISIDLGSSRVQYVVSPNARVVRHYRSGGSILEDPADRSQIRPGRIVTVKVENNVVTEIIVEEYHEK